MPILPGRALLAVLLLAADAAGAATLCAAQEKVVFSCAVARSRIVSVCRTEGTGSTGGSLAYRFGRPGRLELVFPSAPDASFSQFRFNHYFRSQVDRSELNFTNGGIEYSVYDYFEGDEKPATTRGVRVTAGGKDVDLQCVAPGVSRLPELASRVPCDTDNALADCRRGP